MLTFLDLKNRIIEEFYVNDIDIEEYIKPETDLDMLALLIFACKEGLDIKNVDKVKFFNSNSNELIIEPLNQFTPEGNQLLDISLNHILKDDNNYTYRDFYDVFGPNCLLHSENLKYDLEWEIRDALNVDFEHNDKKYRTIGELLFHLNNHKTEKKIIQRNPWWRFWK